VAAVSLTNKRRKAELYGSWRAGMQHAHDETVADLWTAQFFVPLTEAGRDDVCTTKDFLALAVDKEKRPRRVAAAKAIAEKARFFHWHLEFPEVFENQGFDAVLGNPPWERIKLQEEEHWVNEPYIASAPNKAARMRRIDEYRNDIGLGKRSLVAAFDQAKHHSE